MLLVAGCVPDPTGQGGERAPTTGGDPVTTTTSDEPTSSAASGPASTCDDGHRGPDETDLDCGGVCPPCAPGGQCESADDCQSATCVDGLCLFPGGCDDDADCAAPDGACYEGECIDHACTMRLYPMDMSCNDGFPCTIGDRCDANGSCVGGPMQDCTALTDACNLGFCDPNNGTCYARPQTPGKLCDDGNACTTREVCDGGQCIALDNPTGYVFFEPFTAPQEWVLDGEWQISDAKQPLEGPTEGFPDPTSDHTVGTNDDMIAGTVIGGNVGADEHVHAYLTSPVIDTSQLPDAVWLSFWRHYNADADGNMSGRVEVTTGDDVWMVLASEPPGLTDSTWSPEFHDITAFKSATFRVRFGAANIHPLTTSVSGWNIDDVVIAPIVCTP